MKKLRLLFPLILFCISLSAQNSLVSYGFGGRLWYKSYNYTVGSYSAYTVCGENGQLYGWGGNYSDQLGNPNVNSNTVTPVEVLDMDRVIYYSTGYVMGAIRSDSTGWIWGRGNSKAVKVIDDVFFVDAGQNSCAFVKNDGSVWSVGACFWGEFGSGQVINTFSNTPIQMKNITNAVRTAQGSRTTCVLLKDGTVYCAGSGPAIGNGGVNSTELTPVKVVGLKDIVDIKANTPANIALDKNGDVWSWGTTTLGLPGTTNTNTPMKIPKLKDIVAISGCNDGDHFLALNKNKDCYGWGRNNSGLLGTNSNAVEPIFVASDVVEIMAGETFSYIIKSDGSLWAAGFGSVFLNSPQTSNSQNGFIKLDLKLPSINLCSPAQHGEGSNLFIDSTHIPSEVVLFFPNAFTPNGDDNNDIFRAIIRSGAIIDKYRLEVYNRWGQRVFYTEDVYSGWNGTIGGANQPMGSYYYQVTYSTPNRKALYIKGDITLVR